MADNNTPFAVRLEPEDKEKLIELIQDSGKNNKEFMTSLINLYEVSKVKSKNINLVGDIEQLEQQTSKINQIFISIIDKLEGQKSAITEDSEKELALYKEKVSSLTLDINNLKAENAKLNNMLTDVNNVNITTNKQLEQLESTIQDKTALVEEYKAKNDMLVGLLEEYKKYKEEIEEYKKLLADAQSKNIVLMDDLKKNENSINSLNAEVERIREEHSKDILKVIAEKEKVIGELEISKDKTIADLTIENKREVERLKDKAEFEKQKSILELQQHHQKELESISKTHAESIEHYQDKYKQLLQELEDIKKDNAKGKKSNNKADKEPVQERFLGK